MLYVRDNEKGCQRLGEGLPEADEKGYLRQMRRAGRVNLCNRKAPKG